MEEIDPQRYVLPGLLALLVIGAFLILVTSGGGGADPVRPLTPAQSASTTTTPTSTKVGSRVPATPAGTPVDATGTATDTTAIDPSAPASPPPPPVASPPASQRDPLDPTATTETTPTAPPPSAEPSYVKVQHGDTMASIAAATGVSKAHLAELNPGVDPDNLPPGRLLKTGP